ncbi:MAG TPA: TolC family protein [Algoriphagus sp.]|nr:TolC family protein [Algoriphagus sp.]
MKQRRFLLCVFWLASAAGLKAQEVPEDSTHFTVGEMVNYALINSPMIQMSVLDEEIGDRQIKSEIAGWFPQISANSELTNNLKLRTQPIGDQLITFGQPYSGNLNLVLDQTIFNRDVFLASKGSKLIRTQLSQTLETQRINTVITVAKAYYDLLLSMEQIRVFDQNIVRQEKQFKDAKNRYEVGLVDKTDFQRASISLANLQSERNRQQSFLEAKYAYLKQVAGYPLDLDLTLEYSYNEMENQAMMEISPDFLLENRVEYQLAKTQYSLAELETSYSKWAYIPTVKGYYNYNFLFFNQRFSALLEESFPTSGLGLTATIPIFQGGKRSDEVKLAKLKQEKSQVSLTDFEKQLNTEFETALADYNSNYFTWQTLQGNLDLAEEVYNTIKLQYDEGVKAYVDLVVAESELRTAQLNNYNALYSVLSSKLDLLRAMGQINPTSIESSF